MITLKYGKSLLYGKAKLIWIFTHSPWAMHAPTHGYHSGYRYSYVCTERVTIPNHRKLPIWRHILVFGIMTTQLAELLTFSSNAFLMKQPTTSGVHTMKCHHQSPSIKDLTNKIGMARSTIYDHLTPNLLVMTTFPKPFKIVVLYWLVWARCWQLAYW